MKIFRLFIFISAGLTYLGLFSCTESNAKSLNPNGDSELALLMREMHEDGMRTKQQILEGKKPEVQVPYHKMHTAKATQPEKITIPEYPAFTTLYEASVKSLLESNEDKRVDSYHSMVDACISCHQQVCPGPIRKIKKMYLSEKELASMEAQIQ